MKVFLLLIILCVLVYLAIKVKRTYGYLLENQKRGRKGKAINISDTTCSSTISQKNPNVLLQCEIEPEIHSGHWLVLSSSSEIIPSREGCWSIIFATRYPAIVHV
ncbi:hypothetical protein SAY86_023315 [Trapa natans]|uniref:Uncharacterized protein n=1 Tax=Trapa natans TaxID=22666 RepID=A0AAN7MAI1_TRANT|nr:hypothetical protein SAY86_023315 [Trapa natans]